jgi:hypothetical protein
MIAVKMVESSPVPLEWFPRLRKATKEQLEKWRFIGKRRRRSLGRD